MRILKYIFGTLLVLALVAAGLAYYFVLSPNTAFSEKEHVLLIPTGSSYEQVKTILERDHVLQSMGKFDQLARAVKYPEKIHPGRYILKQNMSNKDIVALLASGRQTPVKLVINKFRTKADLSGFVGRNLEVDSIALFKLLDNQAFADSFGLPVEATLGLFIPNTYEFYWNTSAEKFMERMGKEYKKFWTPERVAAAQGKNLTPLKTVILASIIEEETQNKGERPRIAGVYLNRLKTDMKLQADPTLKFAVQDFSLKRITGITHFESPYNTYLNTGLPPGPICTPSVNAIEAVLHAESHKYLYFCAKYGSEEHNFSETYAQHMQYAREYHKGLDDNHIY